MDFFFCNSSSSSACLHSPRLFAFNFFLMTSTIVFHHQPYPYYKYTVMTYLKANLLLFGCMDVLLLLGFGCLFCHHRWWFFVTHLWAIYVHTWWVVRPKNSCFTAEPYTSTTVSDDYCHCHAHDVFLMGQRGFWKYLESSHITSGEICS